MAQMMYDSSMDTTTPHELIVTIPSTPWLTWWTVGAVLCGLLFSALIIGVGWLNGGGFLARELGGMGLAFGVPVAVLMTHFVLAPAEGPSITEQVTAAWSSEVGPARTLGPVNIAYSRVFEGPESSYAINRTDGPTCDVLIKPGVGGDTRRAYLRCDDRYIEPRHPLT